ncbi:MAG: hypothetical protein ACJ741_02415 [Pyrinomonadaceae bacterium]
MRKVFVIIPALFVLAACASVSAQTRRGRAATTSATPAGLVAQLPASDAVMAIEVKRLLNEGLPRAYANNAAELARVNTEIDKFKVKTGLDARQFERAALGVRYGSAPSGATTMETVAVARGAFDMSAIVSAARLASNGKVEEQKYGGKAIYTFRLDEQVKLFGLFNASLTELSIAALDANTLAVGKTTRVREAIDAAAGRGRVSAEIAGLAARTPGALVGLGGKLPPGATDNLGFLSPEFTRSIASIREFYGSVGTSASGFQLLTVLLTGDAGAAKSLSQTVSGLKGFAPMIGTFIRQPERARLLRGVVENTRVSAQGNEVQISLDLAETDLAALIQAF